MEMRYCLFNPLIIFSFSNVSQGVMLKGIGTEYVPDERKEKWIKLKPEYIEVCCLLFPFPPSFAESNNRA